MKVLLDFESVKVFLSIFGTTYKIKFMKNYIVILLLSSFSITNAQQISDYKYIIIPEKFSDFKKENEYQLNFYLRNLLTKKNYEILSENKESWPAEVKANLCLALTADAVREASFRKNIVILNFTDCSGQNIKTSKGVSSIKEYDKGYQDAIKLAAESIRSSNPQDITIEIKPKEEVKPEGNISNDSYITSGSEFQNNGLSFMLTELKDGSFMLIQKDSSARIGQLFPAAKSGVYHVKIFDSIGSYETIGYYDGNSIEIEYMISADKWNLTRFNKIK